MLYRLCYLSFLLLAGLAFISRLLERSDTLGVIVLQESAEPDQRFLQLYVLALEGLLPVCEIFLLQSGGPAKFCIGQVACQHAMRIHSIVMWVCRAVSCPYV